MTKKSMIMKYEHIESLIFEIRGHKVMLDSDIARIYGVPTRRLNEQVRRNIDRFPEDFMFRLTYQEFMTLMSQIATSKHGRGGRKKLPLVFTEHGVIMAANVLNSPKAVKMSVFVVRAFVRMREMLESHKDLARKLIELEKNYDAQFRVVFDAIRELMRPVESKTKQIGF